MAGPKPVAASLRCSAAEESHGGAPAASHHPPRPPSRNARFQDERCWAAARTCERRNCHCWRVLALVLTASQGAELLEPSAYPRASSAAAMMAVAASLRFDPRDVRLLPPRPRLYGFQIDDGACGPQGQGMELSWVQAKSHFSKHKSGEGEIAKRGGKILLPDPPRVLAEPANVSGCQHRLDSSSGNNGLHSHSSRIHRQNTSLIRATAQGSRIKIQPWDRRGPKTHSGLGHVVASWSAFPQLNSGPVRPIGTLLRG
jgi:hypothetical protein